MPRATPRLRPPSDRVPADAAPPFIPRPRADRARMCELVERLDEETKMPGRSCGLVGGPRAVRVFRAIVLDLYPRASAAAHAPSIDDVRRAASCNKSTVGAHLATLRELGLLPWIGRYRIERNGPRKQARRMPHAYLVPDLRTLERLYETARSEAILFGRVISYRRSPAPPPRQAVDEPRDRAPPPADEPVRLAAITGARKRAIERAGVEAEARASRVGAAAGPRDGVEGDRGAVARHVGRRADAEERVFPAGGRIEPDQHALSDEALDLAGELAEEQAPPGGRAGEDAGLGQVVDAEPRRPEPGENLVAQLEATPLPHPDRVEGAPQRRPEIFAVPRHGPAPPSSSAEANALAARARLADLAARRGPMLDAQWRRERWARLRGRAPPA